MKNFWKRRALVAASLALLLACSAFAQPNRINVPLDRSLPVTLRGHMHPMAQPKYDQGPVEASFQLSYITMILKQTETQRAALDQLLADQQNPASPRYRKWLTPEQYADRFGASRPDIETISTWLRSEGFTVHSVARGRDWVAFSGTAAQVERSFHAAVHQYSVDGERHFAISAEPSVPGPLEPIVAALLGLDDFYPKAHERFQPANTLSSGQDTLAPDDLATIYDVRRLYQAGIDGTGQNIVVVGATAVDPQDIQGFRSQFGLSNANIQMIQTGPDPGMNFQLLPEADLDLEWAGAIAPNATLIYLYSTDPGIAVFYAIDQTLAPVISESFVSCEPGLPAALPPAYESEAMKANSLGITWIASAGDTGAAACDQVGPLASMGLAVNFPASMPEVTAVGGTSLNEGKGAGNFWSATNRANGGSALSYIPETAWNDTGFIGVLASTGGGVSTLFPKPDWQTGAGVPNDNARDLPDISMTASPAHDSYNVLSAGQWQLQGGTSAATPLFAGMIALLNQYLLLNTPGGGVNQALLDEPSPPPIGVGNINPALYQLAQTTPIIFHDIVVGSNIVPCVADSQDCVKGQFGYSAGPGYDLVTGLGSADAYNLVTGWNGAPAGTPVVTSLAPSSTTAGGPVFTFAVNGSNFAAGAQVQWNGIGLPTTVASSTKLQAVVDSSLIKSPGIVAITVAMGGASSGVLYFTVNASASMAFSYSSQRVTAQKPDLCTPPTAASSFRTTDNTIYLWLQVTVTANDRLTISWLAPDSSVRNVFFAGLPPADYCAVSSTLSISNLPASQLGAWQARLYDNNNLIFSIPFTVSSPTAPTPTIASVVNGASNVHRDQ